MSTVQEKSRTQLVRELLSELGADTDIDKVKRELKRRHGVTIHETAIYTERRKLREERARQPAPQPAIPPKVQTPPVPVAISPEQAQAMLDSHRQANDLRVFAARLEVVQSQVAKVKALAEEVGGYENLAVLVEISHKLK